MFGNNDNDQVQNDQSGSYGAASMPAGQPTDPMMQPVNPAQPPDNVFPGSMPTPIDHQLSQPGDNNFNDTASTAPSVPVDEGTKPADSNLLNLKQEALQQLSPLVEHLEQTAEEKFRTTMMMIQATDDQGLLRAAYESARNITDDKARAQALLDVINEINYFTQQHSS